MVNKMASDERILEEADYYLNNDVTIEQASTDLQISKRTLQLHLKKLEIIDPDKFKLVTDKKKNNERQGRIKGGTTGKRSATWTKEEAKAVAIQMIKEQMTYSEAEDKMGTPKSTIYEMVHKGIEDNYTQSLLFALSESNRRGITLEKYMSEEHEKALEINFNSDESKGKGSTRK